MIITEISDDLKLPSGSIMISAAQYNISPILLTAIILVESSGNKFAVRHQRNYRYLYKVSAFSKLLNINYTTEKTFQKTSHGYVQIMGATARYLGFTGYPAQLYEADINIRYGAKLLGQLRRRYGNDLDTISAYNQGQPLKTKKGFYKNQEYVNRVLKKMRFLERTKGAYL
jgi:soluble lytic murein transglycosylase-like protein